MGRLTGKNILIIIPKDYYNEEELEKTRAVFLQEDANILIASSKLKEAIGMKNGKVMPDVLIVDAMEGITGDSYVSGSRGTRQIKGIFHGVVVIGGKGAKLYLWKDKLVTLLLTDRYRSGFVVAAIGAGVVSLVISGIADNMEVAAENEKNVLAAMEKAQAITVEDEITVHERLITARGAEAAESFAKAVVDAVELTPKK